jgi:hypothetical protein
MKSKVFFVAICTLFLTTSVTFGYQVTFTPRSRAIVEYTDNVNHTRNNKQEDTITTVSVGGDLDITGKTAGLKLSYDPTYAFYDKNTQDDTWRHYARAAGFWDMTQGTRLDITDSFTISEDPVDDEADPTYRRGRNRYTRNTANINLGHQFGPADSFNLGYDYTTLENQNDFYEGSTRYNPYADVIWWFIPNSYGIDFRGDFTKGEFDRSDDFDSWNGRLRLRKRFSTQFDAFLQYAYMKTEYDGVTENYKINDAGIGFTYIASEDTDLTLVVSYAQRDRELSDDQDGVILTGNINTKWDWHRSTLSLNGSSGYDQDTFGSENYGFYLYGRINGTYAYDFTRNFSGNISAGYGYNRYIDLDPELEEQNINAGTGLSWQALDWMQLRIQYTYRTLYSNEEFREYDENRVFFSITFSPSRPFSTSRY